MSGFSFQTHAELENFSVDYWVGGDDSPEIDVEAVYLISPATIGLPEAQQERIYLNDWITPEAMEGIRQQCIDGYHEHCEMAQSRSEAMAEDAADARREYLAEIAREEQHRELASRDSQRPVSEKKYEDARILAMDIRSKLA